MEVSAMPIGVHAYSFHGSSAPREGPLGVQALLLPAALNGIPGAIYSGVKLHRHYKESQLRENLSGVNLSCTGDVSKCKLSSVM